jgi:hypothetical protein
LASIREGTSIIVPITNLTVGVNTTIERDVNAQNMTTNMMGGNTAGAEDSSGNISSLRESILIYPVPSKRNICSSLSESVFSFRPPSPSHGKPHSGSKTFGCLCQAGV